MRVQEDYRAVQGGCVTLIRARTKFVTLIICGLQLLGHLHVGLNNTSTGLRLTAWPTAGIILTTTQEQEQETVRTPELFKSYGAPCG